MDTRVSIVAPTISDCSPEVSRKPADSVCGGGEDFILTSKGSG